MYVQLTQLNVFLTECTSEEFQCNNTVCVPMSVRCNGFRQCTDGSDEVGCSTGWLHKIASYSLLTEVD